MTNHSGPARTPAESLDRAQKRTLLGRIVIGGALIVLLIGALALFEQQQKPPAAPESMKSPGAVPSPPVPEAQNQASGAIAPSVAEPVATPEPPAEPERTGAPQIAGSRPAEPAVAGKAMAEKPAQAPREDSQPRLIVGKGGEPSIAAKAVPAMQTPAAKPMPVEAPPLVRPAAGGFVVQVGVFSNLGNAEELRKKLVEAGIPAQIEARVHVGPFARQAEAAAAQKKLKSLGMEPGILLSPRR